MLKFRFLIAFLLFSLAFSAFAQKSEEEKIKGKAQQEIEFLEGVLANAKNLRLPENRAFVYAKVGDALWTADEKFARTLFQNAIAELIAAQTEVAGEKRSQKTPYNLLYGQSPRWEILFLIANRDAEFALEMQTKTRPGNLPLTLEGLAENARYSNLANAVKSELQNEQKLLSIAADQNPELAVKRLRESLKKGISYEVLNLLGKIYQKNVELGTRLAEEIAESFLKRDFSDNYDEMTALANFLNLYGVERNSTEKYLKLPERFVRDLALKMINVWLNPNTTGFYGYSGSTVFEKYFPDLMAKVRQKVQNLNNQNQTEEYQTYNKLIQSNASAEELLNQAGNFPKNLQTAIYQRAAERFAQTGNLSQAEKIIKQINPDQADQYISQWQYSRAINAISEGKFDLARQLISDIPLEETQINALTYLASVVFQKDQKENKTLALSILDQARALVPDQPETYNEINSMMNLTQQYAAIEPPQAFSLLESLVPQIDELAQANAVLAKYQPNNGNFRQGEFQINSIYNFSAYNLTNVLKTLKKSDSERVLQITNRFSRLDVRLSMQMQLIESNPQISELPVNLRTFKSSLSE